MDKEGHLSGGCFCGKVRFTLASPPLKIGVCHCHGCKKLTGGTSWSFALVLTQALHVTGELREITRTADSGHHVHVGFVLRVAQPLSHAVITGPRRVLYPLRPLMKVKGLLPPSIFGRKAPIPGKSCLKGPSAFLVICLTKRHLKACLETGFKAHAKAFLLVIVGAH